MTNVKKITKNILKRYCIKLSIIDMALWKEACLMDEATIQS